MTTDELTISAMHTLLYALRAPSTKNKADLLGDAINTITKAIAKEKEGWK